ncbi:MAG: hypothetical protein WC332_00400 [Clostridia bacterium]|jgi:hypothetical protein
MKFTKQQKAEIFNCHVGAGTLIYKKSDDEIISVDILIKEGRILNANTGKDLTFNIIEED